MEENLNPIEDTKEAPGPTTLDWAECFQGVLTEPDRTFSLMIADGNYFDDKRSSQSFFLVLAVVIGAGLAQAQADSVFITILQTTFSIFSGIIVWMTLTYLLYAIAKYMKRDDVTIHTAITLTGWAHAPLCLFPPIYCLEHALGNAVAFMSALPLLWFLVLILVAFKVSLQVGYKKLVALFLLTPPVVCLTTVFWLYILISYTTLKIISLAI